VGWLVALRRGGGGRGGGALSERNEAWDKNDDAPRGEYFILKGHTSIFSREECSFSLNTSVTSRQEELVDVFAFLFPDPFS
jgi:hypothetical protein